MGGRPMADVLGVFTMLRLWVIACGIGMLLAGPARACVERVWVTGTGSNEITVQRASGDLWRLSLNRQCPEPGPSRAS